MNNQTAQKGEHDLLETTAQAIGSTLGSLAVKTGLAKPPATAVAHAEPSRANKPVDQQPGHQHPNRKARRATTKKKK